MKSIRTKLYFVGILLRCLVRFVCHGSARGKTVSPKTILIVQLAWLGDMVCTTPMFRVIKKTYPQCRVIVVGMSRNEKLLNGHPDVDRYVVWKDDFSYMKNELKDEHGDFACLTSPHFLSLAYLYLLGVKSIAVPKIENGFSPLETKSFTFLRKFIARVVPHRMGSYAPREYLKLLEPAGIISEDTTKVLTYSDAARLKIDEILAEHEKQGRLLRVCMSPSSGNKIKNWPTSRFAELADILIEKYNVRVYLIGSPLDATEVAEMLAHVRNSAKVVNTAGTLSVDELKALVSQMDVFISVDTGPIYIAEAFNVATIDIIGPMDENEQPPRGARNINVISSQRQKPSIHIMNSRVYDYVEARKATEDITVDMVLRAFETLIKK